MRNRPAEPHREALDALRRLVQRHHATITLAGRHLDADHPILVGSKHRAIMVIRTCDTRTARHRHTRNCSGATLPVVDKYLVSRAPDTLWPTETITRSGTAATTPRSHPRASAMDAGTPNWTGEH
jgi:hypothetical protein